MALSAVGLASSRDWSRRLLLFGWSPYVLNFVRFGHPFYPLMGAGAADIMAGNTPEALTGLSRGGRSVLAVFREPLRHETPCRSSFHCG